MSAFHPLRTLADHRIIPTMNRLFAFAQSWSAMLLIGWAAGLGGILVAFLLIANRPLCEPVVAALLPFISEALFRSAFHYKPEQYEWIAAYIGGFSALWTLVMLYIVVRAPAEDRRIDTALLKQAGSQEARGAPLER
jgi:hypothetical protein